ncbi:MAG: divalent metal cation transporter [Actinobacteria bacterium]|nr:divalent metal cation transporter [Actinomycetota bacterium]
MRPAQAPPPGPGPEDALPGDALVLRAAEESLSGRRSGIRRFTPFLGPAFIAAVAYIDPGNFATNMAAGAEFGFLLLWVVVAAVLMSMLIQSMSAKLGIASGMNLAEACRARYGRPVRLGLWLQAELVAMATDVAEFVGAAVGLYLLFGIPLLPAAVITGVASYAILAMQARGFRRLEAIIAAFVGVIVVAFAVQVFLAEPSPSEVASGLIPGFDGTASLLLAVGILGATVMPHVIYLHSALTQRRVPVVDPAAKKRLFRFEVVDVVIAMTIAGLVNMSMLVIAAAVFNSAGMTGVGDDLTQVYEGLGTVVGSHADVLFGVALLASGLSSSSVGTLAGQVVMQGFLQRRIPVWLRRAITMAPAFIVLAVGVDPVVALVISQVILSFGIPFALIPLLQATSDRQVMGVLVNRRVTTIIGIAIAAAVIALNAVLLVLVFSGA